MNDGNVDRDTGEIKDDPPADQAANESHVGEIAETVCRDLLEALVLEIKLLQRPWDALPQAEQDEMIERLRRRVIDNVKMAVGVIVSDQRIVLPATVESVTFKDGIKAQLKISKHAVGRHELSDHEGSDVIVVIVDPAKYMAGVHDIRGNPDQAEIGVESLADNAIKRARGEGDEPKGPTDNPRGEG